MAKNAQAEMITIGLQDEGGMVDEASGNEVPNGALKEEVRDDQPAMLSPGEFVIPAYAVRYIGVERLVKLLREAKQGMEQLDDIGLTGEPNADDAGLETAVLPSEMQGGMPKLAVGGFPTIRPGAVTTKALTNQPTQQQQFGVAPPAAIQPVMQPTQSTAVPAFGTAPSPLTQQMYQPTAPIRPPGQQNVTYPEYQYSPTPGGTGYGVEEYVGPQGQAIFVTTIGGKPISKIPEGYLTRAEYTKKQEEGKQTTTPPSELQRKPEEFSSPDAGGEFDPGGSKDPLSVEGGYLNASKPDGKGGRLALTFSEIIGNMAKSGKDFIGFAKSVMPNTVIATLATAGVLTALGKTEEEVATILDGKPITLKGAIQLLTAKNVEEEVAKAEEEAAKAARAAREAEGGYTFTEGESSGATSAPSYEIGGEGVGQGTEAGLALGLGASEEDVTAAGEAAEGQSYSQPSSGDGSFDFGAAPSGGGFFSADNTPTDFSANEGIGRAEGGLITVGNKTYKPEDFGFANKGTFVTKKKTRKRKRGKGLASK